MTDFDTYRNELARGDSEPATPEPLWAGDTGTLRDPSRRALLEIVKGPYLSGRQSPQLWSALLADDRAIRSRLHELFLDLVIDTVDEFAFVRKARTGDYAVPNALRSEKLAFSDTVMLLHLRNHLLTTPSGQRAIIGRDEIYEQLQVYRGSTDEVTYLRNLNGAWGRMSTRYRVIHSVGEGTERVEISPVVKFLIDEERIRALSAVYADIAAQAPGAADGDETPMLDGVDAGFGDEETEESQ